jgi:ATP-dependent RNA helicase DDX3X
MADQLNMNGLSLADSQHAATNGISGRSTYIPPHMRGVSQGPPPSMEGPPPPHMNGDLNSSVWSGPARYVTALFVLL